MSDERTYEADPVVWALQHPRDGVMVAVVCHRPNGKPHIVAEVQETPHGRLLKVYQRAGIPRGAIEPTGPPNDLSRLINTPGYDYLELERRKRSEKVHDASRRRFRGYDAAEPFPADWMVTVICPCTPGTVSGPMLNQAIAKRQHAERCVVVAFQVGTR